MMRLGRYVLDKELARGGQGAVFEARDPASGRRVALKLLLSKDPVDVRRFRQEAQVLAQLAHPNLVQVHELGQEDDRHFLAMEFVEGQDLRSVVKNMGLPDLDWVGSVMGAVADALRLIHGRGLVHRDLKPQNVLIEAGSGRPVLVDLGLVKRDAEIFGRLSQDELSRLSATGEILGTPAYMAPEQAEPTYGAVGPRADVYGLGGILFFLLTGLAPYRGPTLIGVLSDLVSDQPPPDPGELNPTIPASLAQFCQQVLSKSPMDRPGTAEEFRERLQFLLQRQDAPGRRTGTRRLVVPILLAGVGLGIWTTVQRGPAEAEQAERPPPNEARSPRIPSPKQGQRTPRHELIELGRRHAAADQHEQAAGAFQEAAELGDPEAQHEFARLLESGTGVPQSSQLALKWYRRAAAQGHVESMVAAGLLLSRDTPFLDYGAAARLFRAAAEAGNTSAMCSLGMLHMQGMGVERDLAQARALFRRAAEAGDPEGMVALAVALSAGADAASKVQEALHWLKRGAEAGNPKAMHNLAIFYASGRGVTTDRTKAAHWFRQAADRGYTESMIQLAALAQSSKAMAKAFRWNERAAKRSHPLGMARYGMALFEGVGVSKDRKRALPWLKRAAELKVPLAMYGYGRCLAEGIAGPPNSVEARVWLEGALKAGGPNLRRAAQAALRGLSQ